MNFVDKAIEGLLGREGGYVNHPSDRGGPTRWGVTERVARASGYAGDMRTLPRETAREIYLKRYWTGPGFDKLPAFSGRVAEEVFDTGVNMGPEVAGQFLQEALNALNRQGRDYRDVAVDGAVGPATLGALAAFLRLRGTAGETVLLKALNSLQGERYIRIGEARPQNEDFMFGWFAQRVTL